MKKLILPLLLVVSTLFANSQCVPGTLQAPKNAYIIPDSATNFIAGCQGNPYEQILYIKAAKDTVINIAGLGSITADIDSFVVDANITGMPGYLIAESVPALLPPAGAGSPKSNFPRLVIKGDSMACVRISGNVPANAPTGTNNLTINLYVYTSNIHSADLVIDALIPTIYPGRKTDTITSITDYKLVINPIPCWAVGISDLAKYNFEIVHAVPNPTSNTTTVTFMSNLQDQYEYKLVNNLGEMVLNNTIKANTGLNYIQVDAANLSSGLYLFSLSNGKNLVTQKIQVSK
mgnify:CR=1 FL=1